VVRASGGCLGSDNPISQIGMSPYFWLGFALVAIVLGIGNVLWQRRRQRIAQQDAMRLQLEKQKQDRSLL
jgi:hypothetical protein